MSRSKVASGDELESVSDRVLCIESKGSVGIDRPKAVFKVNVKEIELMVDPGSMYTQKVWRHVKLQTSDVKLKGYGGADINIIGFMHATFEFKGKKGCVMIGNVQVCIAVTQLRYDIHDVMNGMRGMLARSSGSRRRAVEGSGG
ncbi:hypothetical protein NDU88_001437 [Pleurodeles waltl]|uniref:Uncharacterized protein n=1 Tax=Pleurodeles waltl TaxID=8319 RepID=A0AAV7LD52_PLEWA|nr:hypothetical protein NDU88_001437 [Pleurodeles waltl]